MIKKTAALAALFLALGSRSAPAEHEKQAPIQLGSRLELFVDDFLIGSMRGVELRLHEPRPAGTALVFDKPWEGVTSGYATIFKDTRELAVVAVDMATALLEGEEPEVNNTEDYDNGVKVVPSYLLDPVIVVKDNITEVLVDSGYWTEEEING